MLIPRQDVPALAFDTLEHGRFDARARPVETFSVIAFYRGKHCPICKGYLKELDDALDDFAKLGAEVVAVSMDDAEKARAFAEEAGARRLAMGYGLSEANARAWGLYISSARPGSQEPERFSEPGLFVVRPGGELFFAQVQSAPFTRPSAQGLAGALKFVLDKDYPARGELMAA